MNIVQKIISSRLAYGEMVKGTPVGLDVDQVYTQDATGTMAWLQFEAIGIDRIKSTLAVSYVDHNMIQSNFMNPDDHQFLQSAAARFGAYFSRPGNGICHQVNLERFAVPGNVAVGTDSHTPTNGGIGMLAMGVGGLDAATVMAGSPYEITMPEIVLVRLSGALKRPWISAMDVILELLRRLTVKGGVGKIFEYGGEGVAKLSVPERATITNMGAELGATTSVFPSDGITKEFLASQGRVGQWVELVADKDAQYDSVIDIDLGALEPLIAKPHSPDAVVPIREIAGTVVNQVCIGSCTNSSYQAMVAVASILKERSVASGVSLHINPGSRQVFEMIAKDGSLLDMIDAGARIMEVSCGPCIGMGSSPASGQTSIRTFNRNFKGRSGTGDAMVYLTNPLAAAVMALHGKIIDPRESSIVIPEFTEPKSYIINDNLIIPPPSDYKDVKIVKGPNIREVPVKAALTDKMEATVLLTLADNITTDDIMPAGSKVLPYRSNIPEISKFVFSSVDGTFYDRAKKAGSGIIVAGENYGQGSSREHAAMAPMYLGIEAILAKSIARIHRANLINFGIIPLTPLNPDDIGKFGVDDKVVIKDVISNLNNGQRYVLENVTKGVSVPVQSSLNEREREIILAGGLLTFIREKYR